MQASRNEQGFDGRQKERHFLVFKTQLPAAVGATSVQMSSV
jgi:hypothetical protein